MAARKPASVVQYVDDFDEPRLAALGKFVLRHESASGGVLCGVAHALVEAFLCEAEPGRTRTSERNGSES